MASQLEVLSRRSLLLGMGCVNGALSSSHWASGKHLLLDPRIVERREGTRLVIGEVRKESRNPLFGEDKPWEVRVDNLYGNVLYDVEDRIFKLWYSPFIVNTREET